MTSETLEGQAPIQLGFDLKSLCNGNEDGELSMKQEIVVTHTSLEIIAHDGEEGIVRLRGRVGIDSSPAFRERLQGMLQVELPKTVIVDLTEVSYMDSSGIATLIEGLKIAYEQQKTLRLRGLQGGLLQLFQATGIFALFEDGFGKRSSVEQVS